MSEFSPAAVGHEKDESVSGDEVEDIVPYEILRAKNIKEKEEMFKHLFPEVEKGDVFKDASKLLVVPVEGASVKEVECVQKKRKLVEVGDEPVRRSARKRKNVNYNYEDMKNEDDDKYIKVTQRGKRGRRDTTVHSEI